MAQELDFTALREFLKKHDMGIDDLFFVLHLGAGQLSRKRDVPVPVREHWAAVAEECHDLWHNTLQTGRRLV